MALIKTTTFWYKVEIRAKSEQTIFAFRVLFLGQPSFMHHPGLIMPIATNQTLKKPPSMYSVWVSIVRVETMCSLSIGLRSTHGSMAFSKWPLHLPK